MTNDKNTLSYQEILNLADLEKFLKQIQEGLSSVTDLDEAEDMQQEFDAEEFFLAIEEHGRSKPDSNKIFIEQSDQLLQRHLPVLLRSLMNCSQDYSAYEVYNLWLEFQNNEKQPERMIETINSSGSELINIMSMNGQHDVAYYTYESSLSKFDTLENFNNKNLKDIQGFILENGSNCIVQFSSLSKDGLNFSKSIPIYKETGGIQINYESYVDRAVETYQKSLSLLEEMSDSKTIRSFIVKTYKRIWPFLDRAMTGFEELDEDERQLPPHYSPDTGSIASFVTSSIETLRRILSPEQFAKDVFSFLPDVLENLTEKDSCERSSELFCHATMLLDNTKDMQQRFMYTYGTRCIRDLLRDGFVEQAAELLCEVRDAVAPEKNQIIVLRDPRAQENQNPEKPLAALINFKAAKEDRDFLIIFGEEIDYFSRNNASQKGRFISSNINGKFTVKYTESIMDLTREIMNHDQDPEFQPHGDYLRICANNFTFE